MRFITIYKLCEELGVKYIVTKPQATMNSVINGLGNLQCPTILLVDELSACAEGEHGADWSGLIVRETVNYLLALNPSSRGGNGSFFDVTPPATLTLSYRLLSQHRYCVEIRRLILYFITHAGVGHLSPHLDHEIAAEIVPSGRLPVWIERTDVVEDVEVLEKIKEEHVIQDETVTVIHEHHPASKAVSDWCEKYGWRYLSSGSISGIEDQCVVVIDYEPSFEEISRARNLLVIVTTCGRYGKVPKTSWLKFCIQIITFSLW